MDEPTDLEFCREVKNQKNILTRVTGFSENWTRGLMGPWKLFFLNMARTLERMNQQTWNFAGRLKKYLSSVPGFSKICTRVLMGSLKLFFLNLETWNVEQRWSMQKYLGCAPGFSKIWTTGLMGPWKLFFFQKLLEHWNGWTWRPKISSGGKA